MANWIAKAQEKAHYKAMEKAIKATAALVKYALAKGLI